jgi:hypothetical protein
MLDASEFAVGKQPDVRAKLTTKRGAAMGKVFPGCESGPMKVLLYDRGVIFPYVPTIMFGHQANWGIHQPTHSNFRYLFFQNYAMQELTVTCPFTATTAAEGRYMEGAMHFFKSAMKMGFGEYDDYRGVPPPVLEFSVWGPAFAKNIPVVIQNFTYNIDSATDYVWPLDTSTRSIGPNDSMLPLNVTFILTLTPTYSTKSTRKEFTSRNFYNGSLLQNGYS